MRGTIEKEVNMSVFLRVSVSTCLLLLGGMARGLDVELESCIDQQGIPGGVVVFVGGDSIDDAAALAGSGGFLVHALCAGQSEVDEAQSEIAAKHLSGKVTVSRFDGSALPFVDRVVNVLVMRDAKGEIRDEEINRVMAPRGAVLRMEKGGWTSTRQPVPTTIDDWTHNLYDAGNSGVSSDQEAGALRHMQWTTGPGFSRSHDGNSSFLAMVSAAGRLFYLMDEGSTAFLSLPSRWNLIARDGFNGKELWRRALDQPLLVHIGGIKDSTASLGHRLVADENAVYVTLGFNAPVTALDSKTGKELWTNAATFNAQELILHDGVVYCVINLSKDNIAKHPFHLTGQFRRPLAATIPRKLVALDAKTGTVLWEKTPPKILPLSLTAGKPGLFLHDGGSLVCLDPKSGNERWRSDPIEFYGKLKQYSGVNVVLKDGVLLYACGTAYPHKGRDHKSDWHNTITALDAKTGTVLWRAPHRQDGIFVTPDLMVADGLVWHAPIDSGHDSGHYQGLDLKTGKVVRDWKPEKRGQMPHHRCYRNRGTERFLFTGWTGVNTFDVTSGKWDHNYWIRGACRFGVMPANGLLYNTPSVCTCSINSKIKGLNALADDAPTRRLPKTIPADGRLVRGRRTEDGGRRTEVGSQREGDWSTYRGGVERHGLANTPLADAYGPGWKTAVGGKLTQPVIAAGRVLVSAYEQHAVYALDEDSGKVLWRFQAGSIVDSPPTLWKGTAIFGCRDGWVYCVNAADGALVWKFRAAPVDRRIVASENLESVWPVHGSVLVLPDPQSGKGRVYAIAGRSSFLDGGLRSLMLDADSGALLSESVLDEVDPLTGCSVQQGHEWPPDLPAGLPDVLSFNNNTIYMGVQPLSLTGERREVYYPDRGGTYKFTGKSENPVEKRHTNEGLHLFSTIGFLDDSEMHRSVWMYGKDSFGGCWGFPVPTFVTPSGQILCVKGDNVYGYGRQFYNEGNQPFMHLFATVRYPEAVSYSEWFKDKKKKDRRIGPHISQGLATVPAWRWSEESDTYVRALLVAANREEGKGDLLFAVGFPEVIDEYDAMDLIGRQQQEFKLDRIYLKEKAAAGELGAKLMVISTADGSVVSETELDSPAVFDGMAAANGKLFISDMEGNVVCLRPSTERTRVEWDLPIVEDTPPACARGENAPNEGAVHAFDGEADTKWLDFSPAGSWIQYDFRKAPRVVTAYAITSANDGPERDPRDWQLKGSNDGKTWSTLDSRRGELWSQRLQKRSFTCKNTEAYRYYRLSISAVRDVAAADCVQIGEIEFLK
jgi:outer membrane protein assembly factor BamB